MKKVVVAMDSFKGTMSSPQVCNIIEAGFKSVYPDLMVKKVPIADGGEGTVETFLGALGGQKIQLNVTGPSFNPVKANYGILSDEETAVIEMAAASGLSLVKGSSSPLYTTTYGTGELMLDALDRGCKRLIIGLGGSATTDGGVGMAAALGIRFLDRNGDSIPLHGGGLRHLFSIDLEGKDPRIDQCEILAACDVTNPLYGKNGTAHVYAPQKGADLKTVLQLDSNLIHYGQILEKMLGIKVQTLLGAGAAGGLGAGLAAFTSATLKPGIEIILNSVDFNSLISDADLVITGEGKLDAQSLYGKVPIGVLRRAKIQSVPVVAIVGTVGEGIEKIQECGFKAIFATNQLELTLDELRERAQDDLFATARDVALYYL